MDAVLEQSKLNDHITIIETMIETLNNAQPSPPYESCEEYDDDYKLSMWVKEKDIIRASGELSVAKTLNPGTYIVDFNREFGYYCQELKTSEDKLFTFSNSIVSELLNEIELFWDKKDIYSKNQLTHKRGILLEGYPGTGKSSVITLVSNKIIEKGGIVFKVDGLRNLDHYISFLRTNFRKVQPNTPIITILEDIEQYDNQEDILLDFLDGKMQVNHHIIIATSNNTEDIPETYLRPSRLDLIIEIEKPDEQTRREYFKFKKVPEEFLDELVEKTEDCTLADLKEIFICTFILDYTIEEALDKIFVVRKKKNYLNNIKRKMTLGL